ncbi:hypothetical protein MANES_03G075182v8 [Manihot esculenta]|uniref:Uncharacterized protein n=1 Tax=Manihot esculenta TaxID=3983 RepID=A0ACB7HZX7_MANES|nr:hypothetical protein MANES_03G075182v8 [Manihot esculenta]
MEDFKAKMRENFEMSDLGKLSYYLGIEVKQRPHSITLNQAGYAEKILEKLGMAECKPCRVPMDTRVKLSKSEESPPVDATLYRSAIGSLIYLVNTRPDLAYSVGMVSRFMEAPTTKHLAAVKQILRYVKGTLHHGCNYNKVEEEEFKLVGYSDSDLARDVDDRKSTTGVIYFLSQSPVTWISQKQKVVALSSCEAEYIAATTGTCQGTWISRLLHELIGWKTNKFELRVDNKSAIALTKNPVYHNRSKHIHIKFHFLRECVQRGEVEVEYVQTEEQLADILTKPLSRDKINELSMMIRIEDKEECSHSIKENGFSEICCKAVGGRRARQGLLQNYSRSESSAKSAAELQQVGARQDLLQSHWRSKLGSCVHLLLGDQIKRLQEINLSAYTG